LVVALGLPVEAVAKVKAEEEPRVSRKAVDGPPRPVILVVRREQ
jgi:hypothetical protein